jgi:flotillin
LLVLIEGAVNQAKIDVADARFKGDVGEKEKVGMTRQEVGRIEADTVTYENEKKAAISQANARLETRRAEYDRQVETAKIEATQATNMRQVELQREFEEKRQLAETERLRADVVAKWKAEYEVGVQKANTELYNQQRKADAELFKKQQEAEGMFITASKTAEAQMKKADAYLYEKQKEAEAIAEVMAAQANGLKMLVGAFNGDTSAALNYLMIDRGTYQAMAKENANAIKGLNPKITVWNQDGNTQSNPIADIYKSLPPLIDTVREQTGIIPPTWLANVAPNAKDVAKSQTIVNGKA